MRLRIGFAFALAAAMHAEAQSPINCSPQDTLVTNRTGTAAVCIAKLAPPAVVSPPLVIPATPALGGSNEPIGFAKLVDAPFDVTPSRATWDFSQTYAGAVITVQDVTAPRSPPGVARMLFTPALPGGSSPAIVMANFAPQRQLYVSAWLNLSQNFVGHPASVSKILHLYLVEGNRLFVMAQGTGANTLTPAIGLQGIAKPFFDGRAQTATSVNLVPNVANASITRGQWQRYEILASGNSPGASDGSVTMWLDGKKILSYSGIAFNTSGAGWSAVAWSPTWGGAGGAIAQTFTMDMDHWYVSSSK